MATHTYTIEQKMSGTGSIHDLASQHWDRVIRFPADDEYAVVTAAYYEDEDYTTHATLDDAREASRELGDRSHQIIDRNGNVQR